MKSVSERTAKLSLTFIWIGTLLASFLANVIWKEIFGSDIQTCRLEFQPILICPKFGSATAAPAPDPIRVAHPGSDGHEAWRLFLHEGTTQRAE